MLYEISEKVLKLESEGKDIIKFNVGDPDQFTSDEIIQESFQAMKKGKTKYSSASGEKKLRERLANLYNTKSDKITITPGSKWAIYSIMHVMLKNGGNVVIPSPHWTAYELIAKELGAEARILKREFKNDWKIDLEKFEDSIDKKTKLIIINNPNNPTSKVIDNKTLEKIVEIADSKNVTILSDECYSDISFVKTKSILDFDSNHIFVNSFSKTFAMTGWRLGFAISNESLAKKITKLNQITITSVPAFIQHAAIKALNKKEIIAKEIREIYKIRADLACKILSKTKLKFSKPDAPFYLFPYCATDSEKLAFGLLDKGIAITPGTAFGDYKEFFRISLTLPNDEIKKGLEKIAEALK